MRLALDQAQNAWLVGEVPVGAVVFATRRPAAGRRHRLQPAGHRSRSDRARRDRRLAPRRAAARQLPAARVRGLRHARAVRDVRDGAAARARQARRLRRARSEGRRRRIGDRRLRQRRAQPSHRRRGRRPGRGCRRGAALVLRRAARAATASAAPARAPLADTDFAIEPIPAGESLEIDDQGAADERRARRWPAAVLAGRRAALGRAVAARRQAPRPSSASR